MTKKYWFILLTTLTLMLPTKLFCMNNKKEKVKCEGCNKLLRKNYYTNHKKWHCRANKKKKRPKCERCGASFSCHGGVIHHQKNTCAKRKKTGLKLHKKKVCPQKRKRKKQCVKKRKKRKISEQKTQAVIYGIDNISVELINKQRAYWGWSMIDKYNKYNKYK